MHEGREERKGRDKNRNTEIEIKCVQSKFRQRFVLFRRKGRCFVSCNLASEGMWWMECP